MIRRIRVFLPQSVDLFHLGCTLAGLYALPQAEVSFSFVGWLRSPVTAALDVDGLRLGVELSDHGDLWDDVLLQWCDVYAKRSLELGGFRPSGPAVIPFGVNWAAKSRASCLAILKAMTVSSPQRNRDRARRAYRYLAAPAWTDFEYTPDQPVEQVILFQTRVWSPGDTPGDAGVNEERIGLLRALKRAFGSRLAGGVVPTAFARQHYAEFLASGPTRQAQYVRWAAKPLVGIYTRGLFGSVAFKMAEFLAASKCIVSEPVATDVGAPLDHLRLYRSHQECLDACETLLSDKRLAEECRRQSWQYYRQHLQPQAHMEELLQRAAQSRAAAASARGTLTATSAAPASSAAAVASSPVA